MPKSEGLINWKIFYALQGESQKNGEEFDEVVIANNKKEAMEVALKNNPEAQALISDWTFKV